jgi:S1-C subfamily serine protease
MQSFATAFQKIVRATVGLGVRPDHDTAAILGTGFVIDRSGLILTNRHVIEALMTGRPDGTRGLLPGATAFLFVDAEPPAGMIAMRGLVMADLVEARLCPSAPEPTTPPPAELGPTTLAPEEAPDIAVCRADLAELPEPLRQFEPVRIVSSANVSEGTPVGILGFPQGQSYPAAVRSTSQMQLTPLLQTGVISARLPFGAAHVRPKILVLDMLVNQGSSGSSLFLASGDVIGVVYATRQRFEPLSHINEEHDNCPIGGLGVFVASGLGLAVPSSRFPSEWIAPESSGRRADADDTAV